MLNNCILYYTGYEGVTIYKFYYLRCPGVTISKVRVSSRVCYAERNEQLKLTRSSSFLFRAFRLELELDHFERF